MSDLSRDEQWKIHDASQRYIDECNRRQWDQDEKSDKWMMTLASGSFGLSFAFINQIVPIKDASYTAFLIAAWACFASVLVLGLCGFMISSFIHSAKAHEERNNVSLKYQGQTPENKDMSVFFNSVAICGYISLLTFIGGVVCLLFFIAKNFVV